MTNTEVHVADPAKLFPDLHAALNADNKAALTVAHQFTVSKMLTAVSLMAVSHLQSPSAQTAADYLLMVSTLCDCILGWMKAATKGEADHLNPSVAMLLYKYMEVLRANGLSSDEAWQIAADYASERAKATNPLVN